MNIIIETNVLIIEGAAVVGALINRLTAPLLCTAADGGDAGPLLFLLFRMTGLMTFWSCSF